MVKVNKLPAPVDACCLILALEESGVLDVDVTS